jgi:phosphoglycolate phosphatase-like HAD superfamily hydrolase
VSGGHVVWDWNGTLLDDLPVVVEAVNAALAHLGAPPITADGYRDHYTRPVRRFYDSLLGREVADDEWLRLNAEFHDTYFQLATTVQLAPGALQAMDLVAEMGWSQSLLSMSPQTWLDSIVTRLGIADRFDLVDGLSVPTGGLKAVHLEEHLSLLGVGDSRVVVVGDTPDDVAAAAHVGADAILFHGGSHHRTRLEAEGVPIAETVLEAARIAVSRP